MTTNDLNTGPELMSQGHYPERITPMHTTDLLTWCGNSCPSIHMVHVPRSPKGLRKPQRRSNSRAGPLYTPWWNKSPEWGCAVGAPVRPVLSLRPWLSPLSRNAFLHQP